RADAATAAIPTGAAVVFLDPPYRLDIGPFVANLAAALALDGLLIVERAAKATLAVPPGLKLLDSRRYGAASVSVLRRPGV
ncbi:MAG: RsmD family RNA methyltransferase, partial [Pseudomonadota bacterium]